MKAKFLFAVLLCLAIGFILQWPGDALSQEGAGTPQAPPTATLPPPPNSRPTVAPPLPTSLSPTMPQPTSLPPTMPAPPNPHPDQIATPTYAITPVLTASPVLSPDGWTTYADTDPALIYAKGTWQRLTIPEAMGGTLTFTADPHAYLSVYFEGTGIRIIHSAGPDGNSFTAQLDNQPEQTGSAYFTQASYGHQFIFENLTPGNHVLTIFNGPGTLQIEGIQVQGYLVNRPAPPPSAVRNSDASVLGSNAVRTITYDVNGGPFYLPYQDDLFYDPPNSDQTVLADIGFQIKFFSTTTTYSQLYVDINGYVAFDHDYANVDLPAYHHPYRPVPLDSTGFARIAPFWADISTQGGSPSANTVEYGQTQIDGADAFVVTWRAVDCTNRVGASNTFQLILIEQPGNVGDHMIEFNYDTIEWEAGSISGGDANCIINPNNTTIEPPRAGFGDGATAATELPGSGDIHAFLDIDPTTGQPNNLTGLIYNSLNSSQLGRYRFYCRNGTCDAAEVCTAYPDPNPDPPAISQEALDMIAIATDDGLLYHAGPTINAQRDPGYFLAWDAVDGQPVTYRLEFTDDPHSMTWYGFDDSTYASGVSWFVGSMTDDTPTGPQTYTYATLNTACGSWTTLDDITFPYDREAAAQYGIAHSYRNSIPIAESQEEYPTYANQATSRIDSSIKIDVQGTQLDIPYADNLPHAYFAYNFLTGGTGASSSAVFNSEAIWVGGLPMTYNVDTQVPPQTETITLCQDSKDPVRAGWRFCFDESGPIEGNGTWSWSTHQGLVGYYSDDPGLADNVVISQHGSRVAHFSLTTTNARGETVKKPILLNIAGNLRSDGGLMLNTNQQAFFDTFINPNTSNSETITGITQVRTGDYIFTERFTDYGHGYLIVGWGEVMSCPSALDMLWTFEVPSSTHYGQLYPDFSSAGTNVVPYVVDFPGSIDRGSQTQKPRPRPFYCADFRNLGYQRNDDGFAFYTLNANDSVTIPTERVYVLPEWQWE